MAPLPALEIHCDQRCPTGQEKTSSPYASTPEGWNQVWRCYPQTRRVSAPLRPHSLSRSCYGTPLWDSFPVPLVVPPRLSAQGQGAGTSVGRRGWTGVWGVGGAAPIHFRMVRDHHCLPSHPVAYYYQTTGWHPVYFYVCDSTKKKPSSGCVVLASNLHTRTLQASTHSVFLTNTHSPHRHTVITTGASQQTYTSDCVCVVQLFLADCVWEGQSHRR